MNKSKYIYITPNTPT